MAAQLNITLTTNGNPTVVVPIPAALQSLDSSADNSNLTGFSAIDQLVRGIFRAGGFFVPSSGTWYSTNVVASITAS